MKSFRNERGVALMLALMLSFISLAIIAAVVYLVTQGTTISGIQKRYQTAQESAKGGVELVTKEIIERTVGSGDLSAEKTSIQTDYSLVSLAFPATTTTACLQQKLLLSTQIRGVNKWTNCNPGNMTLDPKDSPDVTFQLSGLTPEQSFSVFAKIVDTVGGNTDTSGLGLEGLGVVESGSGMVTPKHDPFMYRVEVQSERTANPDERANISVLYAY